MKSIPIIDYSSHPGYADLNVERNDGTELVDQMAAIDDVFARGVNGEQFRQQTQPHWDRMATIVKESVAAEAIRGQVELAIRKALDTMTAYCGWSSKPKKTQSKRHYTDETSSMLDQLDERGCAATTFPESVLDQLKQMLASEMDQTVARHETCAIDRCTFHMQPKGDAFDLAWKTLRSIGLLSAVNEMFGRQAEPMYWYFAHNTATESWYKDCYADVGLPTSRFAYAHFDNDFELAKIQIYLTDVGPENGPFSFVPGSHKWTGCKTQQYIFKELDRTLRYPKDESLYYRPRFKTAANREDMMRLPVPLQGTSHFGDDVVDGTELAKQLEQNFHSVTSDQGNCCVFAGGDLLHYGGLVEGADRWVLQLGVATQRPHSAGPPPRQTLLRKLASTGRKYVGNKPVDAVRRILGYRDEPVKQQKYQPLVKKESEKSSAE